jgi:hypothetical protein
MTDYRKDFRDGQREFYWSLPRIFLMGLCAFAALAVIGWVAQGNQFFLYKVFAPQYEAVRRDVMLESRAYSEATTREFNRLRLQYVQAKTEDEKAAIRAMALHEAAAFDKSRLPVDLQSFLTQIGG